MDPISLILGVEVSSETKVTDLKLIGLRAYEKILWLDIPMHHVLRVKVLHSFQELIYKESYTFPVEAIRLFFKHFQQIFVHKFENEIQLALSNMKQD